MENSEQKNRITKQAKMKIFRLAQKNFDSIGVNTKLSLQPYPFNKRILTVFLILAFYFICNLMSTVFEAKTFNEYAQSIYMDSVPVVIISFFVTIVFNAEKLFKLINDCENLVNATLKYSASRSLFDESVQFEHKLSQTIFFVMSKVTPVCGFLPWTIYTAMLYFFTDLGNAAINSPVPIWFPFDWKNLFGSSIALVLLYIMVSCALKTDACIVAVGFGICLYMNTMSKCIKQNLFAISQSIRSKSQIKTETERKLIREQFIEYIEFDSSVRRLINDYSDTFKHFIMLTFLWSLVTICGALLIVQVQILQHDDNLAVLLLTLFEVIYAFGVIFSTCEIYQRVNLAFDECSDIIDQFKWYLFPADIQRILPSILQFSQQPVEIKCFGTIPCNRETFKFVISKAFSYFMVLREFY